MRTRCDGIPTKHTLQAQSSANDLLDLKSASASEQKGVPPECGRTPSLLLIRATFVARNKELVAAAATTAATAAAAATGLGLNKIGILQGKPAAH